MASSNSASPIPATKKPSRSNRVGGGKEQQPESPRNQRAPDIFDGKLKQRHPDPGNKKAEKIEPRRRRCPKTLDQPKGQHHAGNTDRHVKEKDRPPRKIGRQK